VEETREGKRIEDGVQGDGENGPLIRDFDPKKGVTPMYNWNIHRFARYSTPE
jgi:hypothetical protein